ncbi:MAG: hypothetical protein JNL17_07230 [Cyclobacteriaceae bacterium]|nr:hypothetical protein [Cyclobacteriaceae bacterium]
MDKLLRVHFEKAIKVMKKEIFRSERYFVLFDYFVGHGQLLIRSSKKDGHPANIDVIFFDTTFIQSFTMLRGLIISLIDKNAISSYPVVHEYLKLENSSLFELESGGEKFYVAASFVKVYENDLGFSETSLGMVYQGRETEISGSR